MKRCLNYSEENKQCKFNYCRPVWVNSKDYIPNCDGYKTEMQCTWYKGFYLDIAGNDYRLKKFRERLRNGQICDKT